MDGDASDREQRSDDVLRAAGLPNVTALERLPDDMPKQLEAAGFCNFEAAGSNGRIPEGATAVVLKARERDSARTVALKVQIEPEWPRATRQFDREARILFSPNLPACMVRILRKLCLADGRRVLVLEYIDGHNLAELGKAAGTSQAQRQRICRQLLAALGQVHEAGIVYGDLSPNNVMVDAFGEIRFVDFGQARRLAPDSPPSRSAAGTPEIAPPELLRGNVDPKIWHDVRSAVATCCFVLTGRSPDALTGTRDGQPPRGPLRRAQLRRALRRRGAPRRVARLLADALTALDAQPATDSAPPEHLHAAALASALTPAPGPMRAWVAPIAGAASAILTWQIADAAFAATTASPAAPPAASATSDTRDDQLTYWPIGARVAGSRAARASLEGFVVISTPETLVVEVKERWVGAKTGMPVEPVYRWTFVRVGHEPQTGSCRLKFTACRLMGPGDPLHRQDFVGEVRIEGQRLHGVADYSWSSPEGRVYPDPNDLDPFELRVTP